MLQTNKVANLEEDHSLHILRRKIMKFTMKKIAGVFGIVGLLASAGAQAATANASFQVTATVIASCSASATALAFGNITPDEAGTEVNKTSDIKVVCSNGHPYTVKLNYGANAGTIDGRFMKNGTNADTLKYQVYTDLAHANVWNNTTGVNVVAGTGTGQEITHTVYGQLKSNQFVSAGNYADTIQVAVEY
jgi:hypothetical protein